MLKLDDLIKDLSQTQNLSFSKGVINAKLPIFFFFLTYLVKNSVRHNKKCSTVVEFTPGVYRV